jgi:hypothetical protein
MWISHLFAPITSAQTTVIGLHFPDLTIVVTAIREAFVITVTEVHKNGAQRYSVQTNKLADRSHFDLLFISLNVFAASDFRLPPRGR